MKTKQSIDVTTDMTDYINPCPKSKTPLICKHCGQKYNDLNIYNGFCSWTCKSKFLKLAKQKKEEQEDGKN